ncbi:MAG: DUF542 domain-containing protein [Bryobacteraceae bacterium]
MNPTTFDRNRTVREIAIDHPASTRVFESFGIDYCCSGRRPLQEACKSANAPLDKVVQALMNCWQAIRLLKNNRGQQVHWRN